MQDGYKPISDQCFNVYKSSVASLHYHANVSYKYSTVHVISCSVLRLYWYLFVGSP
jgi:hypothetical protein